MDICTLGLILKVILFILVLPIAVVLLFFLFRWIYILVCFSTYLIIYTTVGFFKKRKGLNKCTK